MSSSPLRIEFDTNIDYVDPALAYYVVSWQLENATCAKLVRNPDLPPPAGSRLQPEIAASMPTVSADGRTYTFQIRNDYFFSPPATGVVTAASMKYTFERLLHPSTASPGQFFYLDILGAQEYIDGTQPTITGIVANGNTLSIQLVEPSGDFLRACDAVHVRGTDFPPHNPDGVQAPVPSAGPSTSRPGPGARADQAPCSRSALHRPATTALEFDSVRIRPAARDDPPADREWDD